MVLYKDGSYVTNSTFSDTDFMGNADYIIPDGSEIAEKVKRFYPYIKIVTNTDGDVTDVIEIEHDEPETVPEITTEQRLEAAENAIEEIITMLMGG